MKNGFSPNGCKPRLNKKILDFIRIYRTELYLEYYGYEHPQLKLVQLHKVHDILYEFSRDWLDLADSDDSSLLVDSLIELARGFFERVSSNDHNINHFVSGRMLEVRYYDSGFY